MAEAASSAPQPTDPRADQVLDFWFSGGEDAHKRWFAKDPLFDAEIRDRFMRDYESARNGAYDDWQDTARGCLALVVLLDQFPRNMFRGDPRAFATDAKALDIAQHAIAHGFDKEMSADEREFLYLPFQHSEDKLVQERSLELYRALSDWDQPGSSFAFAQRHWDIIRRFNRFPHRNATLGRDSTPAEIEFLKQPDSGF